MRIEIVASFSPTADDDNEIGLDQKVKVLRQRLAGHGDLFAEFAEGLSVFAAKRIQQESSRRISQCFEHLVEIAVIAHLYNMQAFTCISQ